jgi:hypothetical protein
MVMVRFSDNRSDKELLERELKAAESAVRQFGNQALNAKVPAIEKTANFFFGKKGDQSSADIAAEQCRRVLEYHQGILFDIDSPTSFSAIENNLAYLADQLRIVEADLEEFDPSTIETRAAQELALKFPPPSEKASAEGAGQIFFASAMAKDRRNPIGLFAACTLLEKLACLKIFKIIALTKSLRGSRVDHIDSFYKGAASWPEHKLLLEIEKRESAAALLPKGERHFSLKLFTVASYTVKLDQDEERVFANAVVAELKSIAYQGGNRGFIRKQSPADIVATKQKEQLITEFIAGLAPSKNLPPEDRIPEHVDRVTAAIKEKLRMTQARDEMLKQYPAEYHWYIKKQFRTALEDLN